MGLCASAADFEEKPRQNGRRDDSQPKKSRDVEVNEISIQLSEELIPESDEDFRLVIKEVVIMALERACKALQFEKEGYTEIANKRGHSGYMSILAPDEFRQALESVLEIGQVEKTRLKYSDINYEQDQYLLFLKAARAAPYKDQNVSRSELEKIFKKACTATQNELQASVEAADASDLKLHLYFFINCLDIIQSGQLAQKPGTLLKNVETFVSGEPVGKHKKPGA